jgi:1,4-alpha-glucan branching enzyme
MNATENIRVLNAGSPTTRTLQQMNPTSNSVLPRYSARRNLHRVSFFCEALGAQRVALIGDFNDWNPAANPMSLTPEGGWMASLELTHGFHQYLFLVDGKTVADPRAAGETRNDRNERVSLVAVS